MASFQVNNAGIVLLNNYIPILFERLGLTVANVFVGAESQRNAVHYLQYVITGLSSIDEVSLPLNNVLCGLPIAEPLSEEIVISEEHKALMNGLIAAVISSWSQVRESTIDGFRGNWLIREGALIELEDRWELTVEKRAYDVLLTTCPFSFSIVKFPWMGKVVSVEWGNFF